MKILIVDAHNIVHRGLTSLIGEQWPNAEIDGALNLEHMENLLNSCYSAVIVEPEIFKRKFYDLERKIHLKQPESKILVFTQLPEEIYAIPFLKIGAMGYVGKSSDDTEIISALNTILSGGRYSSNVVKELYFNYVITQKKYGAKETISIKEKALGKFLLQGLDEHSIAKKLGLTLGTTRNYKMKLFRKLNVRTLKQLADKIELTD